MKSKPIASKRKRVYWSEQRATLVKSVAQGKTIAQAGKEAGYGTRQASHDAFKAIQRDMPEAFARIGCLPDKALTVVAAAMEATKTERYAHQGVVIDSYRTVDHAMRLRAADRYFRLTGLYPGRNHDAAAPTSDGPIMNVIFTNSEDAREFAEALRAVQAHCEKPVISVLPEADVERMEHGQPVQTALEPEPQV